MIFVRRHIIAMRSKSRACAIIDSCVVTKDCLCSGKSSSLSKIAWSEKARGGDVLLLLVMIDFCFLCVTKNRAIER